MAPPDRVSGTARTHLHLSVPDDTGAEPNNRADQLARRLEQRLRMRLDKIRTRLDLQAVSPNTEHTGQRLDILA